MPLNGFRETQQLFLHGSEPALYRTDCETLSPSALSLTHVFDIADWGTQEAPGPARPPHGHVTSQHFHHLVHGSNYRDGPGAFLDVWVLSWRDEGEGLLKKILGEFF